MQGGGVLPGGSGEVLSMFSVCEAKASACTVEVIDDDDVDDAVAERGRELVRKRR